MKRPVAFLCCFLMFAAFLGASEPFSLPYAGVQEAKQQVEEDPNINISAATLESGPSAVVGGCVNAVTGTFFDSGIDLVLPGPQPLVVQHTFCNLSCTVSHMPTLQAGPSKHGNHLNIVYTDDNGSSFPFTAPLEDNEPSHFLRITGTNTSSCTRSKRMKMERSVAKRAFAGISRYATRI